MREAPSVSPAYAGIDPPTDATPATGICFPRIRGDRPRYTPQSPPAPPFPPHTRGSTPRAELGEALIRVSPAYAGIDLNGQNVDLAGFGFPRIRGDRPDSPAWALARAMFPPHTRGSTHNAAPLRLTAPVSPAYAGIDRRSSGASRSTCRFPRIRGDRPRWRARASSPSQFPPHTRGSTPDGSLAPPPEVVSPAYAGIDRKSALVHDHFTSFPRIRGDRPLLDRTTNGMSRFPPHTRGSTRETKAHRSAEAVSPAYAGIDRRPWPSCALRPSFPRIRGDRPRRLAAGDSEEEFPPHTRGSTLTAAFTWCSKSVSPAYAGIDPESASSNRKVSGFPRIRGDRPPYCRDGVTMALFPPHTRGSTGVVARTACLAGVSPAYAGIDRSRGRSSAQRACFPRIRGDRPHYDLCPHRTRSFPPHTRGSTVSCTPNLYCIFVSPAYAGIDRSSSSSPSRMRSFPRIRGDRPDRLLRPGEADWFPPHTRGSTGSSPSTRGSRLVSPAYAGIDRIPGAAEKMTGCFPRIRGDRPCGVVSASRSNWFPPHTRGSTPSSNSGCRSQPVSPAYAGIDPRLRFSRLGQTRFPRIRGDRPGRCRSWSKGISFPPHTRGSTLGAPRVGAHRAVSPAYAGIDPTWWSALPPRVSFPRIRGDRPTQRQNIDSSCLFPPHTRGSTWQRAEIVASHVVSPAYAGIDPECVPYGQARVCFPRIRGDRPHIRAAGGVGDQFPPHTRGSTLPGSSARSRLPVSPAYAGIDLRCAR